MAALVPVAAALERLVHMRLSDATIHSIEFALTFKERCMAAGIETQLTEEGMAWLKEEIRELRDERLPELAQAVQTSAEDGRVRAGRTATGRPGVRARACDASGGRREWRDWHRIMRDRIHHRWRGIHLDAGKSNRTQRLGRPNFRRFSGRAGVEWQIRRKHGIRYHTRG